MLIILIVKILIIIKKTLKQIKEGFHFPKDLHLIHYHV